MEQNTLLETKSLSKSFPGVQALSDVSFKLYEGEVLGICGENGAGKSTLIKCLSGVHRPTYGTIEFEGNEVDIQNEDMALELGISVIYQELSVIEQLDIAQNIYLGQLPRTKTGIINFRQLHKDATNILKFLGLEQNTNTIVEDLSISVQQMVEIGKAMSRNPKVLIMDEPTSSLGTEEIDRLFDLIKRLKSEGCAIIYISHNMDEIFKITDRILVLRDGKGVESRNTIDWNVDSLVFAMVNREINKQFPEKCINSIDKSDVPALEVKGLTNKYIKDISFSIQKGEILGIAGIVGAGRSEVLNSIFGVYPIEKGTIEVNGKQVNITNPRQALNNGISLMSEDRKNEMLCLDASVKQNFAMPYYKLFSRYSIVDSRKIKQEAQEAVNKFNIKVPSLESPVIQLSGGNQQKVIMARIMYGKPFIYCLDEPTRGIDVNAKQDIYKEIIKITENGGSVILVTSELPELLGLADRVLVMRDNTIVAEVNKKDMNQELIMNYATGGVKFEEFNGCKKKD